MGIGISLLITCFITYMVHWRRCNSEKKKMLSSQEGRDDGNDGDDGDGYNDPPQGSSLYHSPNFPPTQLSNDSITKGLNISPPPAVAASTQRDWEASPKRRSKADRPAWVVALSVTGALLLLTMTFDTGTISPDGSSGSNVTPVCPTLRYFSLMTLGFSFWISLVLYKLIRKYFQARLLKWKEAPSAIKTIALLMLAPCLITVVAMINASVTDLQDQRNEVGVCEMNSPAFMIVYLVMWIFYFALFLYLAYKVRKTIGEHHELYRYAIFLSTSFAVIFTYFIIQMTSSLSSSEAAQQTLLSLTIIMVTANMGHIFGLIYNAAFSNSAPKGNDDDDDDSEVGRDDLDSSDPLEDQDLGGTVIPLPLSFQEAKRDCTQKVRPNFDEYLLRNGDGGGGEIGMIDRGLGFWNTPTVPESSLKSGADGNTVTISLDPSIIERGQKYLDSRHK